MAETGADWETVGKTNKKTKVPDTNGLSKTQATAVMSKMPRLEISPPLRETSTIYDALVVKAKKPPPPKEKPAGNGVSQPTKKKQTQKNKSGDNKPSKPTVMAEAVKQIDLKELEAVLTKVQATFPENPVVWLKDLASVLNLKMDKVPESDPVFQGKSHDYPVCLLPTPVKKMLKKTINQSSTQTLQHFLDHCVQSMVVDMKQGISTYGYRMFIQLLLHDKPDIIMPNLNKYQDLMKANQNRALRCLSIMWAVGQVGVKRLDLGLRIWLDMMFNTLSVRALSGFSIEYIENLFRMHENLKPAMSMLKVKEFFHIVDVMFTPQASIPSNLHKRLQALYPKFQAIAFGANPESNLNQFFPHYFARTTDGNKHIREKAVAGLVTCLSVDKSNFSEWRQLYTKNNLHKSGAMLQHLCRNWNSVIKVLDKKKLMETISSFNVTNEDMAAKDNKIQNTEGYQTCATACKEILAKMSRTKFPWRWLVFFILSVIGGLLAYDVYVHKGYKKSKTNQVLTDTGVLFFFEQVFRRFQVFTNKAIVWLQENVPYYYSKVCEFAGPYLQLFWEKLYDLAMYVAEVSKPARAWLNEKVPLVIEWVQEKFPWVWEMTRQYLRIAWEFIVTYSLMAWHYVVYYLNIAGTWLLENVFVGKLSPENILETLSGCLAVIQSYIMALIQWCSGLINGSSQSTADPVMAAKQQ